ncbi:hypothetical protein F2Q69_00045904 [Brassica cretica]|uniref:Translation elongation factor KOW-like domain-containing protein n=1 Tax=Brassica cretica TaxID=69181 RepID=A0A8S9ND83_BRACR|nr:hypothetical protein F2Q69_00045904 [Brassica cretica]
MAATWTSFVTSLCISSPSYKPSSLHGIYALSSNDIKVGTSIEVDGAPWRVLEFLHVKPGKGAAFVRTKIRNYVNGSTVERTFRAGITIEEANVFKETKQFTYKDGSQFVFMDLDLDLRCEELIKEEFGERCNFDVDDAVQKLDKLGIVARDTIGRYYCMGLKRANEIIGTTTEELVHKAKQGVTPS